MMRHVLLAEETERQGFSRVTQPGVTLVKQPLVPYCQYKVGRWRKKRALCMFALLCCDNMTSAASWIFPPWFQQAPARTLVQASALLHPRQREAMQNSGHFHSPLHKGSSAFMKHLHPSNHSTTVLPSPEGKLLPQVLWWNLFWMSRCNTFGKKQNKYKTKQQKASKQKQQK